MSTILSSAPTVHVSESPLELALQGRTITRVQKREPDTRSEGALTLFLDDGSCVEIHSCRDGYGPGTTMTDVVAHLMPQGV